MICIQADLWDPAFSGPNDDSTQYDHFTDFARVLARHAHAFGRPVLLLNGDSHEFTDDRPLADPARPYQKSMYGITGDVPNLRLPEPDGDRLRHLVAGPGSVPAYTVVH